MILFHIVLRTFFGFNQRKLATLEESGKLARWSTTQQMACKAWRERKCSLFVDCGAIFLYNWATCDYRTILTIIKIFMDKYIIFVNWLPFHLSKYKILTFFKKIISIAWRTYIPNTIKVLLYYCTCNQYVTTIRPITRE